MVDPNTQALCKLFSYLSWSFSSHHGYPYSFSSSWPTYYASRVSNYWKGITVDCLNLVLAIELISQNLPYSFHVYDCCCFSCGFFAVDICLWNSKVLIALINICYSSIGECSSLCMDYPSFLHFGLLIHTTRIYSRDTGMSFWLEKCSPIVTMSISIWFYAIHVEKMTENGPISEFVSIANDVDLWAEGVQAYAEHRGKSISLVHGTFDQDLRNWLKGLFKGGFPQPHRGCNKGSV
ncbi:hypothetical protein XENOCAPTIV_004862 [Xenoophorus captivus]|uniref:Uncharacterized protein n=1 Tax=Xenoophorus captivus TaxID=1517983 RepID=A0ABV0R027_9TELE